MPNTTLPTSLTAGDLNHLNNHVVLHTEMNRITRDTGLRDVSTFLLNGWKLSGTTPHIRIQRRDGRVSLHIRGLDGSAATNATFLMFAATAIEDGQPRIANGFRPANPLGVVTYKSPVQFDDTGALFGIEVLGSVVRTSAALPNHLRNLGAYERTIEWGGDAWPTFLPPAAV